MNAGTTPLLQLSFSADASLSAMLHYGTMEEFESSGAPALQRSWEIKSGIPADGGKFFSNETNRDLYNSRVGSWTMVKFKLTGIVVTPRDISRKCDADMATHKLSRMLAFPLGLWVSGGELELHPKIERHAYRHLLTALKSLPPGEMTEAEANAAVVKAMVSR